MKKLYGNLYFELKDINCIIDTLLGSLSDKHFISSQSSTDRSIIDNAIKKFRKELVFTVSSECAIKIDYIETIYTQLMHPAINLLSPEVYNQIPYHDITQTDMKKVENWFFNYGLSLVVAEFEKI